MRKDSFIFHLIPFMVLALPYLVYFYEFSANGQARPISDSFRYMWEGPVSLEFFSGSSITVKLIYRLVGNNLGAIAYTQLLLVLMAGWAVLFALREEALPIRLGVALFLAVLSTSDQTRKYFDVAVSESIYTSLMLGFTALLFASRHRILIIVVGILFVFSRNAAPYIVLGQLVVFSILRIKSIHCRDVWQILVVLATVAIASIVWIQRHDTTSEINVADNIYTHILGNPERVMLFHERYGMPLGPFASICNRGSSSVNDPCLDHQAIYTGDAFTRQYRLTDDDYGFSDWVRLKGMRSWQHYLFILRPWRTVSEFTTAFEELARSIFKHAQTDQMPIDAMGRLGKVYAAMGLLGFPMLGVYLAVAFVLCPFRHDVLVDCGIGFTMTALAGVFLGVFGDSEEIFRYTYPSFLVLYIGLALLLVGMARSLASMLAGHGKTNRPQSSVDFSR